jgi:RNA ligase
MIHYEFPVIKHLDDVKEVLNKPEFGLYKKDGYQVINYNFVDKETFTNPIEAECRGLIFDLEGNLLSRRYHKFFNLGEHSDVVIDLSKPHVILEKLDGSMVSPVALDLSNGIIRFMSKMGITDTSMQAEEWAWNKKNYTEFLYDALRKNTTPIFEWCSRKNKIVIDYPEDKLILTAIRDNETGEYFSYQGTVALATSYNIPVVGGFDSTYHTGYNLESIVEDVRKNETSEGIVIRFEDGHMVKVKSEWYVKLHRAKDDIASEKKLLRLILDDCLDDVLPLLTDIDKDMVLKYRDSFWLNFKAFCFDLENEFQMLYQGLGVDRKTFALSALESKNKTMLFNRYDGHGIIPSVQSYIERHLNKLDEIRHIIGPAYKELSLND